MEDIIILFKRFSEH